MIPEALTELSEGLLLPKHAYYLATFPAESQKKIVERGYAYKWQDKSEGAATFDDFKEMVEENIVRDLATAPFDTKDSSLHVTGLICSNCPQQTGYNRTLFEDDFKGEKCLDPVCFAVKMNTYARHQQEELAKEIIETKIPDEVSGELPEKKLEEVIKSVPLVTEKSSVNKKELSVKGTVLTDQELYDEPQCEFSIKALAVDGAKKNQKVYVCQNEKCPTHHPEKITPADEKSGPTDYELRMAETNFQIKTGMITREKVLAKSIDHFTGSNSFWQYADLIEKLIVEMVILQALFLRQLFGIFEDWKNFPKNLGDREAVELFVGGLDARRRDQLLLLCIYAREGSMNGFEFKSQNEIKELARSYARTDYYLLEAEARLEHAPEEFKALAAFNVERVKNGLLKEVDNFWWDEPKFFE